MNNYIANLDCELVENALIFVVTKIGGAQTPLILPPYNPLAAVMK